MNGRFGYRSIYLLQNLGKLEAQMLIWPKCKEILRDPVTVQGNIFCYNCSYTPNFPINSVREIVEKLEIRCPLVDKCNWTGLINQARTHIEKCVNFRVSCHLNCGAIFARKDMKVHIENKCNNRLENCKYCQEIMKFYLLQGHYLRCPTYPLECSNLCGNKIARSRLENHITRDCPLTQLPCPLNCGSSFSRKDMPNHTGNKCELRLVPCKYCHKDIRFKFLDPHTFIRCLQFPIKCPNFCNLEMPRCKLEDHLNTVCPLADVSCPFYELGCMVTSLKRKDLRTHQKDYYIEHQELLLEDRKSQNRKLFIFFSVFAAIFGVLVFLYLH